jgi:hypothetical protein
MVSRPCVSGACSPHTWLESLDLENQPQDLHVSRRIVGPAPRKTISIPSPCRRKPGNRARSWDCILRARQKRACSPNSHSQAARGNRARRAHDHELTQNEEAQDEASPSQRAPTKSMRRPCPRISSVLLAEFHSSRNWLHLAAPRFLAPGRRWEGPSQFRNEHPNALHPESVCSQRRYGLGENIPPNITCIVNRL